MDKILTMDKMVKRHACVQMISMIMLLIYCFLYASQLNAAADCSITDPYPALISNINNWDDSRFGQAKFTARGNNKLNIYFYIPTRFNQQSPVVFVMHGAGRNALDYLQTFAPVAEQYNTLALAPEFPNDEYPYSEDYSLGVGIDSVPYTGNYNAKQWKNSEDYLYSEIEHLFETVKQLLGIDSCGYYILGHSAGGQFVHRLSSFLPNSRMIRGVAANSGWYTLPSKGDTADMNYYMPYGLQGSPITNTELKQAFKQDLVILVGEDDTRTSTQDSSVRNTAQANYQGSNRNSRGRFYYQQAQTESSGLNTPFKWRFDQVPQARHDFAQMVQSAAWYLAHDDSQPICTSSSSSQANDLIINEIHADPAFGPSGDANSDGSRHSSDDEFIEIVNNGKQNLCLSGWTLGDSSEKKRHVFPLGTLLKPGQAIVIFGGGIPTGNFSNALVQWAAYSGSLSLTNQGDGIRLYDSQGHLAKQITWGTCGDMDCAEEHISFSLEIDAAVTRWPELNGAWQEHDRISQQAYSPGAKVDGSMW